LYSITCSLIAVLALAFLAYLGVGILGLDVLFGVILPYLAFFVFTAGIVYRVFIWARVPVPFRIPTTCGQQKTLPWIKSSYLDNPHGTAGVVGRMALEVLLFRSLFRNTRTEIQGGSKVIHGSAKLLWLGALAFHWTFLVILIRHLRFFLEPVPRPVQFLAAADSFMQVGIPLLYASSFIFVAAVSYLFIRRVVVPQLRYISLASDYFPLFLLLGIGLTGILMQQLFRTPIDDVKALAMGLVSFHPAAPEGIHYIFYIHLLYVCVLLMYFPFSKLLHMPGVFLSPTRNLANNNRSKRHINPWNYPVKVHTYQEYEDEFREKMKQAGIPVEKE